MQLLHRAAQFTKTKNDLRSIYLTYIRPVLEQSATGWHSSITEENAADLCRVQKAALRIIMGSDYISYPHALTALNIDPLHIRREKLCLNMALRTCSNKRMKSMFPLRNELRYHKRRFTEKYKVNRENTQRLKSSSIPYMQGLLNEQARKKARWT